jgi:hypothetical protein
MEALPACLEAMEALTQLVDSHDSPAIPVITPIEAATHTTPEPIRLQNAYDSGTQAEQAECVGGTPQLLVQQAGAGTLDAPSPEPLTGVVLQEEEAPPDLTVLEGGATPPAAHSSHQPAVVGTCSVCWERPIQAIILECGHTTCCMQCMGALRAFPAVPSCSKRGGWF